MARFTYTERIKLVKEISAYIIKTKASTRKTGKEFDVSNATVSDWMNGLLKKVNYKDYLLVQAILNQNTPKTIEDEAVKNRVLDVAKLILEGFTVEEISKSMNVTTNVINEDLQTRLPRISTELAAQVKEVQKQNSLNNLNIGSNMSVEGQIRDENGRFTK